MTDTKLGISGRIAASFLSTEITPLLALLGLLLGLFAVLITAREEEPQIHVTFANVFIPYPGASAKEVESLVTIPAEQIVSEIEGVDHVYSSSAPGMAALTVRFKVGEARTEAIVRLYNAFYSNQNYLPANLGVGQPLIQPKGIDDVPIVAGTLWSENPQIGPADLLRIAHTMQSELQRVPGTRDIEIIGAPDRVLHVQIDPERLGKYKLSLNDLRSVLQSANASQDAGEITQDQHTVQIQAGTFLRTVDDFSSLVVGESEGAPVFLRDVATVSESADTPQKYVTFGTGPAAAEKGIGPRGEYPALTLSVSKKPGENAVVVADKVIERFEKMRGIYFPDGVQATVTRNYGETAKDKAQTLIKKLIFATLSVVLLVWFALGRREAVVVGAAVIVTLAITLFASWAWGFTLNRVSLFALIFSIGILVDDAIVVVENIHRHRQLGNNTLVGAIPAAVDEVGGPTILATFTVIAALLPMAFVSGLMGPYMRPIPINASTGMLISLAVAFIFTPWLYRRLFVNVSAHEEHDASSDKLLKFFTRIMTPFLRAQAGMRARWILLISLIAMITVSILLVVGKVVIMKMLPFDNKSEFQILVDMPEGSALEDTQHLLTQLGAYIKTVPEVTDYQTYAGASAPINFNGLVRQYYLRTQANQADLQVNLLDKHKRHRKSHEIALSLRGALQKIAKPYGASVKIVEVPPGPPVLAPLVAEIYGLDYNAQINAAKRVAEVFAATPDVVDVDTTVEAPQEKRLLAVDRSRAALLNVSQSEVTRAVALALRGEDMSYLHDEHAREPVPVRVELPSAEQRDLNFLSTLRVRANNGALVPLSELTQVETTRREQTIYHKDLLPVVYVTGDVAGPTDSPLYGLIDIHSALQSMQINGDTFSQYFTSQPDDPYQSSLKWDGEWQVTYETFRDMGAAYAVGLILIYLLVVAQFRSYGVPLIIMAPIPLTMIGILPGHALLGQQFTAPSMIGMIALAGIIVRNSILLVDFIQQEVRSGKDIQQATIAAAAIRSKPIALTALAAMLGGFFILDDPIFGGLAISLIFGLFISTILTLLVIPVVYYHYHYPRTAVAQ